MKQNLTAKAQLSSKYDVLVKELCEGCEKAYKNKNLTTFLGSLCKKYDIGSELTLRKIIKEENIIYRSKKKPASPKNARITEKEFKKLCSLYCDGWSVTDIINKKPLGERTYNRATICSNLSIICPKYKKDNPLSDKAKAEMDEINSLYLKGLKPADIAKQLLVSKKTVTNRLNQLGYYIGQGPSELELSKIYEYYMNYKGLNPMGNTAKHFKMGKSSVQRAVTKYRKMHNLPLKDTSDAYRLYTLDKNYFSEIDSAKKALFLGWIATDQYVHKNTNKLQIEVSRIDTDIVNKFCDAIGTNKKPRNILKNEKTANRTTTKAITVDLYSKRMLTDLASYGIHQNKSKTIEVNFNRIPAKFHKDFWLGAIYGDGSLRLNRYKNYKDISVIELYGSKTFVSQFKNFIKNNLNVVMGGPWAHHGCYRVAAQKEKDAKLVADFLFEKPAITMGRKIITYKKLFS